ncbi:MAG: sulfatase-like hydrolase/transferase, partial [Candidatus Sumerlaeota bacterium]|nr:sulfatase-like hydrolase/transferase [Candidatus Sumerlaeota bacterium]
PQHYDAALATIWPTGIPELAEYGPKKFDLRKRILELRRTFRWATPDFPQNTGGQYTLPFPEEVSQTHWITERALEFLRGAPPEQPLYAHISYVQPHSPFCPPAECMRFVNVDRIPAPAAAEWIEDPHAPLYFRDKKPAPAPNWRQYRQYYFADIVHLDRQLGRVVDALQETGRLEDAWLVFLADHGEMLADHALRGKEEKHYDACIRVPLIIAGPGANGGEIRSEMVQLEDICPTVLDIAGLRLPPMPKMGPYLKTAAADIPILPGRSLLSLCRGEEVDDWRTASYCESYNAIWSIDPRDWARTIRTRQYRYTFYAHEGGEQLFDLRNDPDEQRNLAADPGHARVRQELRDQLMEMIVLQDHPKTRRDLFALGVH